MELAQILAVVSAFGSMLGSLGIFVHTTIWIFSNAEIKSKFFSLRIISYLSISDFLANLFLAVGVLGDATDDPEGGLCKIQAAGIQFFYLASFLWTFCFAHSLYLYAVKKAPNDKLSKWEIPYHILSWTLPAITTIVMFAMHLAGFSGVWCWISEDHHFYRFSLFYFPLWAIMLINLVLYVIIVVEEHVSRLQKKLALYSVIVIICWMPGTLYRAIQWANGDTVTALLYMQAVLSPLQGFLNAIVYGWTLPILSHKYGSRFNFLWKSADNTNTVFKHGIKNFKVNVNEAPDAFGDEVEDSLLVGSAPFLQLIQPQGLDTQSPVSGNQTAPFHSLFIDSTSVASSYGQESLSLKSVHFRDLE